MGTSTATTSSRLPGASPSPNYWQVHEGWPTGLAPAGVQHAVHIHRSRPLGGWGGRRTGGKRASWRLLSDMKTFQGLWRPRMGVVSPETTAAALPLPHHQLARDPFRLFLPHQNNDAPVPVSPQTERHTHTRTAGACRLAGGRPPPNCLFPSHLDRKLPQLNSLPTTPHPLSRPRPVVSLLRRNNVAVYVVRRHRAFDQARGPGGQAPLSAAAGLSED
eukprot:scaffold24735_cov131-Isochrysis_galbana.AAC.1